MKKQIQQKMCVASATLFFIASTFMASAQMRSMLPTNAVKLSDISHASAPLAAGILVWDTESKTADATNGQVIARLAFNFTNVTSNDVTILHATPSCGCTTVEMPRTPWLVAPGSGGQIKLTVNLSGKVGTLFKTLNVITDQGRKSLSFRVNIAPPVVSKMTEAQRAAGIAAAKVDRQAVFKGDCATCHLKDVVGSYGPKLYAATCAICHEANPRASMVPNLHKLADTDGKPIPTNEEFWRAWITAGKADTLMPAFAVSQGGPLNDIQIASLAAYLNATIPSRAPATTPK